MYRKPLVLIATTFLIAACAGPIIWTNPHGNAQKFEADKAICTSNAMSLTRYEPTETAPTYKVPESAETTTRCDRIGNSFDCTTKPKSNVLADFFNRPQTDWGAVIRNKTQQNAHFEACMYSRGYQKQTSMEHEPASQVPAAQVYELVEEVSNETQKVCHYRASPQNSLSTKSVALNEPCPIVP
jgi:hypothetical protein